MGHFFKLNLVLLCCLVGNSSIGQEVLNGDFEINTAGFDRINLTNIEYGGLMSNSIAFGTYNGGGDGGGDMDIIGSTSFCGLPAQQGTWYIAFTGGGTDMISLELSEPLVMGSTYTVSFYDRFGNYVDIFPFQVGVSSSATDFGVAVYTAPPPVVCEWTHRTFSFASPTVGKYLTFKITEGNTSTTWAHLDNVSFEKANGLVDLTKPGFVLHTEYSSNEVSIVPNAHYEPITFVRVLNTFGQEILQTTDTKFSIANYPPGIYLVEVSTIHQRFVSKFIKK